MLCLKVLKARALSSFLLIGTIALCAHGQAIVAATDSLRPAAAATGTPTSGDTEPAVKLRAADAYRLGLLEMKGQLAVARTLLRIGVPGAHYHLHQPVQKIFRRIQPQLQSRNAPLTEEILKPLAHITETTWRTAIPILDSVDSAIDGSFAQVGSLSLDSTLALSEALLRRAVYLYTRSVANDTVIDVHGYQTGRGLVLQAEALVRHSNRLRGRPGHDALLDQVVLIRQSWPGVIPPPIVFSPKSVAERLDETVAAMKALR